MYMQDDIVPDAGQRQLIELDSSSSSVSHSDQEGEDGFSPNCDATTLHQLLTESEGNDANSLRDYSPFPSQIFALLFMLVHSPRPIVSSCCLDIA